jgi:oxalate decarboxylase/phosphoglucose isomerase-like protein (cupin superfamily)
MTVVYLKPCGLNIPHIHPRASTISYVAKGRIRSGFWSENTGEFIALTLNEGQGTAFGSGALHFEQNIGCEDAVIVAAFNNEDPGTAQLTEGIQALPLDILTAAFGASSSAQIEQLRQQFPTTPALGIQ